MDNTVFEDQTYEDVLPDKGTYHQCRFLNLDLKEANLSDYVFTECVFENCDFSLAKCKQTGLMQVTFIGCKLLGFNFESCKDFLFEVRFENCLLNLANFYKKRLKQCVFKQCILKETDFTAANLNKAQFIDCDLSGAIFYQTNIEECDFRTAYHFSIDPENNQVKKAKFSANGLAGLLDKYQLKIDPI